MHTSDHVQHTMNPFSMPDPKKNAEFQRRSQPITDDLVKHLQGLVPAGWRIAMLQLDVSFSPINGMRSIKHRLWNPLTDIEICDFPEALFQTTTALHTVFTEYHQAWTRCLVRLCPSPRGGVGCEFNYHYAHSM